MAQIENDPRLKDIMDTAGAANFLGIHVQTVKHHVYYSKRIRGKKVGGVLVFHRKELESFRLKSV